jgi:YHS domain-containing protein
MAVVPPKCVFHTCLTVMVGANPRHFIMPLYATFIIETSVDQKRSTTMVTDPVCGMRIDEFEAASKGEYKGKAYYFCSPSCKSTFDKEPARYAEEGESG